MGHGAQEQLYVVSHMLTEPEGLFFASLFYPKLISFMINLPWNLEEKGLLKTIIPAWLGDMGICCLIGPCVALLPIAFLPTK